MVRVPRSSILLPLLLLHAASVDAEILGYFTTSTNYLWRGVTQTDDKPAISAALEYQTVQGSYLGVWSSNIDYGDRPSYELDLYLGHHIHLPTLTFDLTARYYYFPSAGKYSHDFQTDEWLNNKSNAFNEIQVGITRKGWIAGYAYSNNFLDSGQSGHYLELNHIRPLPGSVLLKLHIGAQESKAIDDTPENRVGDYSAAINWRNLTFTASNLTDNIDGRQSDKVRYVAAWHIVLKE